MKKTDFSPTSKKINESLRTGEYYIWTVHFQDGTSSRVKIVSDTTSKESIEKHFGKPVAKIDYSFSIKSAMTPPDQEQMNNYHRQQDELLARRNLDRPFEEAMVQEADETPAPGDQIRTNKMTMDGVVESIEGDVVFFRLADGRRMKTPLSNVTVVEKIIGDEMGESIKFSPGRGPDVDHMHGAVYNHGNTPPVARSNRQTHTDYSTWEKKANHLNTVLHNDDCEITSDRYSSTYTAPSGKIFAAWNKRTNVGFVDSDVTESIDDVLENVYKQWNKEKVNELSTSKLNQYKDAAGDPVNIRSMPLRKLAKHVQGVSTANSKLNSRQGVKRQGPPASYDDRLAEFVDEDFDTILNKQHQEKPQARPSVKDIPYHGWTIRYRPSTEGAKVPWQVMDKKGDIKQSGESMTDKDAVGAAEEWIKSGGGTQGQATSNVTIDFNIDFSKEFAPNGETFYAMIDRDGNTPVLIVSSMPQKGLRKSHTRTQKSAMGAETVALQMISLSAAESNKLGLQPNGRYMLGDKDPVDDTTAMFPLIFQSTAQSKTDRVRLGKPGLTVAHAREMSEDSDPCWANYKQVGMKNKSGKSVPNCVPKNEAITPWGGYTSDDKKANALQKAPKSSMTGSTSVPFSTMVQDSIKQHGLKWAFNFYVIKHGLPPRHFKIYAGL